MKYVTDDAQIGGSARPRRPTMEDVALRAGVSRPLVSIVFRDQPGASDETRARVRAAAAEIGYRPDTRAQLLSRKQTRLIGVSFGVGHEFHAELVTELYAAAQDIGYELVLSGVTPIVGAARRARSAGVQVDAVILLGPSARLADLAAIGRQTPTVVVPAPPRRKGSTWYGPTTSPEPSSPPAISSSSATAGSSTSTAGAHQVPRTATRLPGSDARLPVWDGWPASSRAD
jgi:hypothetical protein